MSQPTTLTPGPSLGNRLSKAVFFYLTFILLYRTVSSATGPMTTTTFNLTIPSPADKANDVFKGKSK